MAETIGYDPLVDDSHVLDAWSDLQRAGQACDQKAIGKRTGIPDERVLRAFYRLRAGGFAVPLPPLTVAALWNALDELAAALRPLAAIDAVNNDDRAVGRDQWLQDSVRCDEVWAAREALDRFEALAAERDSRNLTVTVRLDGDDAAVEVDGHTVATVDARLASTSSDDKHCWAAVRDIDPALNDVQGWNLAEIVKRATSLR